MQAGGPSALRNLRVGNISTHNASSLWVIRGHRYSHRIKTQTISGTGNLRNCRRLLRAWGWGRECPMPLRAIARKFLPHTPAPEAVAALGSTVVAVLLLAIKFVAYYKTGSAGIFFVPEESIPDRLAAGLAG